jgi:hypothetical protein
MITVFPEVSTPADIYWKGGFIPIGVGIAYFCRMALFFLPISKNCFDVQTQGTVVRPTGIMTLVVHLRRVEYPEHQDLSGQMK